MNKHGANITVHSFRRVIMALLTSLYTKNKDLEAATEIAREIISSGRRSSFADSIVFNSPAASSSDKKRQWNGKSDDKTAHNIKMRLKEKYSKFSGDIGEL